MISIRATKNSPESCILKKTSVAYREDTNWAECCDFSVSSGWTARHATEAFY